MNIFKTFDCPFKCARVLDDKRVVKMVVESAQILSTTMHISNSTTLIPPYKTTHINHPCVKWAAESRQNFVWLLHHFIGLCNQYTSRYEKIHKCMDYLPIFSEYSTIHIFPKEEITPHFNCTQFKDIENINLAYKECLLDKWANDKREPKWHKLRKDVDQRIALFTNI